MISRLFC